MQWLRNLYRLSPWLTVVGWIHLALAAVAVVGMAADSTTILGVSRWLKPFKFDTSVWIYVWTMAWIAGQLPASRSVTFISRAIAATMLGEIVLIHVQALRGTTSHFNHSTPFDDAVFGIMGLMIAFNTVLAAWVLVKYFRGPVAASPLLRTAVQLGLIAFLAGSAIGGGLLVGNDAHTVGAPDGGPGLPLVNWSTQHGDLRPAHFFGMHGLQLLPLAAWLTGRRTVVWGLFAVTIGVFVITAAQALRGMPLVAM